MQELTGFQKDLKAAFKLACERAGGAVVICKATGYDASRISRYGNPDDPWFPPIHIAHLADRLAGEPFCLQVMAREWGFELTPIKGVESDTVINAVAEFCDKAGELQEFALRAASDGRLSPNEKRGIRQRLGDVSAAQRDIAEHAAA